MRAIVTAAAIMVATSANADFLDLSFFRALGSPIPDHFESRGSCLRELARAIRHAERSNETADILTGQIAERSGQTGAQEAIDALNGQTAASEAYVVALMTLCQSYD